MIINAEGRFKLLEKPMAYPFHDIVNRTPDGPVFDLVDVDGYDGVVYITADHVVEMAKLLGMIHGEEVESLHDRIKELEAEKNRLPEGVDELVSGINELVATYHSTAVSLSADRELFDIPLPIEFGAGENKESVPDARKADGQSSGPDKHKRGDKLPSNSGDEFGLGF